VTVHVHPDGTTDATVNEGSVEGHNDLTNDDTSIAAGEGATFGHGGNTGFNGSTPSTGGESNNRPGNQPEQRRGGGYGSSVGPGGSVNPGP